MKVAITQFFGNKCVKTVLTFVCFEVKTDLNLFFRLGGGFSNDRSQNTPLFFFFYLDTQIVHMRRWDTTVPSTRWLPLTKRKTSPCGNIFSLDFWIDEESKETSRHCCQPISSLSKSGLANNIADQYWERRYVRCKVVLLPTAILSL